MTKEIPVIQIKEGRESSLRRFHPWVFSGAISGVTEMPVNGEWVKVVDSKRKFLGAGHYQEGSISVRILTFQDTECNQDFWVAKLGAAWNARQQYQLMGPDTNMFRWVHGEGDGLSGLIIDVYDQVVVVQPHTIGMEQCAEDIAKAIQMVFTDVKAIYLKPSEKQLNSAPRYLFGEKVEAKCFEHGIRYSVDWETGQKTGFFIDQRENRKLLGTLANGKKVLNTFCYSGGFSLTALKGGARHVDSLDSSASALELTLQNIALNDVEAERHQVIKADAVEYLKTVAGDYDIIVLDPPAFAKHLSARHKAVQGYRKINEAALRKIQPGGLIFTFSCSQAIDKETFKGAVMAAAIDARRPVRILYQLHQPADHPIGLFHPEGEYLKGLVIQVQ
jgi:23S rRNA (cytosine1962-C5)-methyltransferase